MTSQINRPIHRSHTQAVALVLSLAALSFPALARAQSSAPAESPPAATASTPTAPAKPDDKVVKLDPFEVSTAKDTSYGALNSNSITRFNTELSKTPVVADIFTKQFMQDTQVQTVEQLFTKYGTAAGMTFATPSSDSNATQPGDRYSSQQYGLRGLPAGSAHRDGFDFNPTFTTSTSIFDIDRVEIIHGSQGLLYGATGAGGVVNIISKQANFNQKQTTLSEQMDQHGSKQTNLDSNWGDKWLAIRIDAINQDNHYRRLFLGDTTDGYYGQLAFHLPFKGVDSTLRLMGEQSHVNSIVANNTKVTTNDSRNGDPLTYLYVSHQLGAANPTTGQAFASGVVDNGYITNQNMQSFAGWRTEEDVDNGIYEATLDTVWTPWLSTSVGALYDKSQELRGTNIGNLFAPNTTGNPFPNDWAIGSTMADSESPNRKKTYRANVLLTNDISDWAHSQTAIGFDREYADSSGGIGYSYYLANSSGGVTLDPTKTNLGRIQIPTLFWQVNQGPVEYPYTKVGAKSIMYNGQLYVRMPTNPRNPAWITPNNPLGLASLYPGVTGVSGGNSGDWNNQVRNQGYYVANYTSWWNDRVDTLLGVRETDTFSRNANTSTSISQAFIEKRANNLPSYNAGIDFRLLKWMNLRGYYGYSRSFNVIGGSLDALGVAPPNPTGWTHEGGLKFQSDDGRISGDLSVWTGYERNDNFNAGTNFRDIVNPSGLNGSLTGPDGSKNQWAAIDHTSRGVELSLTAAPTSDWRLRFSASIQDGTILKDKTYPILYNDQFYTDGHGNVTHANGQPFLVPVNPATVTVGSKTGLSNQTTPVNPASYGVPMQQLTIGMLNTPGSPYYAWANAANQPLNGSIGGAVGGAGANPNLKAALSQFRFGSNTGPSALTGVVGLPISAIQYDWSDPANYQGTYTVVKKGNYTVGYPVYSTNTETDYTFSHGPLKGIGVGGTLNLAWYYRTFYFQTPDRAEHLYSQPLLNPQVNVFFSYTHKFRWVTWTSQVNINNLFNRYVVSIYPNDGVGFGQATSVGATYYGEPRTYVWTNRFSF